MNADFFLILGAVIAVAAAMSAKPKQHGGKTKRRHHRHNKSVKR